MAGPEAPFSTGPSRSERAAVAVFLGGLPAWFENGYGDERASSGLADRLVRSGRQLFAKVSYAWQR